MGKEITATQFLKSGKFPDKGLVLIYGPEEVFHETILKRLKREKFKYTTFYGDEIDLDKFVSLLGERNLFSDAGKTVNILLKGELFFEKLKKRQKEKLQRLLKLPIKNLLIVFLQKELTKKELSKEPYKTLFGRAELVISAQNLNKAQLTALIKKKFQQEGIKIEDGVIQFLQNMFTDTLALKNEIEKLILYALDKKSLTLSEVKELVVGNPQYSVFDFQKAFFNKNPSQSMNIFTNLLRGVPSYEERLIIFQLQGLLTNTVNKLLVAKEKIKSGQEFKNFAKQLGLYYPFQVSQYSKWLKLWKEEELIKVLKSLYQLDVNIKTKFLPPAEEFKRFLVTTLGD